jgi:hypothetical protein
MRSDYWLIFRGIKRDSLRIKSIAKYVFQAELLDGAVLG